MSKRRCSKGQCFDLQVLENTDLGTTDHSVPARTGLEDKAVLASRTNNDSIRQDWRRRKVAIVVVGFRRVASSLGEGSC